MRNPIKRARLAVMACTLALAACSVQAATPMAVIDANARARGNDRALAVAVGERLFTHVAPVQVLEVEANTLGPHSVLGIRLSGVKFHGHPSYAQFENELVDLVTDAFATSPNIEEIDMWASVPIKVIKGSIVSGDLATPTSRPVFTLTALRGETGADIKQRIARLDNVFIDAKWQQSAFGATHP